jgi:polar amino acid transport system substrate-binding protein
VFLEKPLALGLAELEEVTGAVRDTGRILMTGFNRRFAPGYRALRKLFRDRDGPIHVVYRVNAGLLPADHWTRDPVEGGGRVAGEACHFVDLMIHLAGRPPERVYAEALPEDGVTASLRFADGSVGTLVYATTGDAAAGKERLEVHGAGVSAELRDFRRLRVACDGRTRTRRVGPGKGHREEVSRFLDAVRTGRPSPVPFGQAAWSTRATLAILESAGGGRPVLFR